MAFCRSKKSKEKLSVPYKGNRTPSFLSATLPPRSPNYINISPSKKRD